MLANKDLEAMHNQSMNNKELLSEVKEAGCFHCDTVFKVSKITEWEDDGKTAICPNCKVDAVIPKTKDVTIATLEEMNEFWFGSLFTKKAVPEDKTSEQK